MAEKDELKASVVFTIGLVPAPIVKFDKVVFTKIANGAFTPALVANVASGGGLKEADFPVTAIDVTNQAAFEELRKLLHTRIDSAFDGFLSKWKEKYAPTNPKPEEVKKPELVKNEE